MNPNGNGLGLNISKNIAKCLKGDLTCESKLGYGSAFSFTFEAEEIRMVGSLNQPQIK